jgi:pumilio family protein 6
VLYYFDIKELFRSIKELFDNEYGRKVITYLVTPRDSKFFIKDYVKRLEAGDGSETIKKDAELKRKELFEYSKAHLKDYINKEINNLLYNGASGILIPFILEKLEKDGDEIIKKIANIVLEKEYEQSESADQKQHCIEDSTAHFILKQLLKKDTEREKNGLQSKFNFNKVEKIVLIYKKKNI